MSDRAFGVNIEPDGDEWELRRVAKDGSVTNIRLSNEDVLSLVEYAPLLQDRALSRLPGAAGTMRPVFASEVQQIAVGRDVIGQVLMEVSLLNGPKLTYSLSGSVALRVARRIAETLQEAHLENPTKQ